MAGEAVHSSSWDNLLQVGPAELPKMVVVWLDEVMRKGGFLVLVSRHDDSELTLNPLSGIC